MRPGLRKAILEALAKDRVIKMGVKAHPRTVVLHLTEEQYQYLKGRQDDTKVWRGLGWFMRRLLIIDMVKRSYGD